jgi:hypothetical protein
MPVEIRLALHRQQRVQQAGIAHVQLGRLVLPLADVLEPRRQPPHQERASQEIEIAANRVLGHAQRPRQLGPVPDLRVTVGEHQPEAPERLGGDADAQFAGCRDRGTCG